MGKRRTPMWFDVPVTAPAPSLISESVGLRRIIVRPAGNYRMEVSIFDSPDARLLRAGITVAHRRRDEELGEWYVAAPAWPGLPDEATFDIDAAGDLPKDIRHKLSLFLRGVTLQPFATIICERKEYMLRGDEAEVATIRDDLLRVRCGETVRPDAREIVLSPSIKLTAQQRAFIRSTFEAVDATFLNESPSLARRIGSPATGLSSIRPPAPLQPGMTLEEFVSEVFVGHLHRLILGELRDDKRVTKSELAHLRMDLRGLSSVFAPVWREQMETILKALPAAVGDDREGLLLRIIDGLVVAARAPQLGDLSNEDARSVLWMKVRQQLVILYDRCRALEYDGGDDTWGCALRQTEQLDAMALLMEPLFGKPARRFRRELSEVILVLRTSVRPPEDFALVGITAEEAFQLGRDVEHAEQSVAQARRHFLEHLPEYVAEGRRVLKKMRKRLP